MPTIIHYNLLSELDTPGGTVALNSDTDDSIVLLPDECTGLGAAPVRIEIDDVPGGDGGLIIGDGLQRYRELTLTGLLVIRTSGDYFQNQQALSDDLITACESIFAADGTLKGTPPGGSELELTVRCTIPPYPAGTLLKKVTFTLVALDPNWT